MKACCDVTVSVTVSVTVQTGNRRLRALLSLGQKPNQKRGRGHARRGRGLIWAGEQFGEADYDVLNLAKGLVFLKDLDGFVEFRLS